MAAGRDTILVVDDNEMILEVMSRHLEKAGYRVLAALDGQKAIDMVSSGGVDLVLLDIAMPGLDGFEVLKTLRKTFSPAQLPVMMVTALSNSEYARQSLDLGASDCLTKPIDITKALERIRIHLQIKHADALIRESLERHALASRRVNDGLWDLDLRTNRLYLSPRWKSSLGYGEDDIGTDPEEWFGRVHEEDIVRLKSGLEGLADGASRNLECECRILDRAGDYRRVLVRGIASHDGQGKVCRVSGSQTDISRAHTSDALTGLPTRPLLLDQLQWSMEMARRDGNYSFALIFLDLDEFKSINENLGQWMGDQVLIGIGRRLQSCLRPTDLVARLHGSSAVTQPGGDEFSILVDNVRSAGETATIAERIRRELFKPFVLRGREVTATASMGIAINKPSYQLAEDMLRDADIAMDRAKKQGKASLVVFDPAMAQ